MTAKWLSVALHDVSPATQPACADLLRDLHRLGGVPVTMLAVPRHHGRPRDRHFERWLLAQARQGHELALHGYTHWDEGLPANAIDRVRRRWYTAQEGEFAGLSQTQARLRLEAGLRWFAHLGVPVRGFIAPAWLLSAGTWAALKELPFDYTCTLTRLVALPSGQALPARALVYSSRSAWRRAASVRWNALQAVWQRDRPLLRVELHPGDALFAELRTAWMRLLRQALTDRRVVTLTQALRASGAEADGAPREG